jgi:hypothetical protein
MNWRQNSYDSSTWYFNYVGVRVGGFLQNVTVRSDVRVLMIGVLSAPPEVLKLGRRSKK